MTRHSIILMLALIGTLTGCTVRHPDDRPVKAASGDSASSRVLPPLTLENDSTGSAASTADEAASPTRDTSDRFTFTCDDCEEITGATSTSSSLADRLGGNFTFKTTAAGISISDGSDSVFINSGATIKTFSTESAFIVAVTSMNMGDKVVMFRKGKIFNVSLPYCASARLFKTTRGHIMRLDLKKGARRIVMAPLLRGGGFGLYAVPLVYTPSSQAFKIRMRKIEVTERSGLQLSLEGVAIWEDGRPRQTARDIIPISFESQKNFFPWQRFVAENPA